jgi:hypothetical protein
MLVCVYRQLKNNLQQTFDVGSRNLNPEPETKTRSQLSKTQKQR